MHEKAPTTERDTILSSLQKENTNLRKQNAALQREFAKALLALELKDGRADAAVLQAEIVEAKSRLRVNNLHSIKHLQQTLDNIAGGPDRMKELQMRLLNLQRDVRK